MPTLVTRAAAALKAFGHTVSSGIALARDAYFRLNGLILKGNSGDVLDTVKELAPPSTQDYSTNNFTLSTGGGTLRTSKFSPLTPGYYSYFFSATGTYLTGSNAIYNVSNQTLAWTVEYWVYPVTAAYHFCIGSGGAWSNSLLVGWSRDGTNKFSMAQSNGGSAPVLISTTNTYTAGKWYHIAATNDTNGVRRLFVNGVQDGTQTYTAGGFASGTTFVMNGTYDNNGMGANGGSFYVSNMRFLVGETLYTTNFTPNTSPLSATASTKLLSAQSNTLVDNSSIGLAYTLAGVPQVSQFIPYTLPTAYEFYGSAYFDGSTYATASITGGLGNGDFTVEGWVCWTSAPSNNGVFQLSAGSYLPSNSTGVALAGYSGPRWHVYFGSTSTTQGGNNIVINQWYHFAITRVSGNSRLYINGVLNQGPYADAQDYSTATYLAFGAYYSTGYPFTGYISNFRIIRGSGYSSAFTPPATILTAVSGTQYLSLQYNGSFDNNSFVDKSGVNAIITKAGNSTQGTFSPYNNDYSVFFNGSSDYLTVPQTFILATSTTPFTLEAWVFMSATTGAYVASNNWAGGGAIPFVLGVGGSTTGDTAGQKPFMNYYNGSSWATGVISSTDIALNTWTHIAGVFDGTTASIYNNGVRTGTWTTTWTTSSQVNYFLGKRWDGGANVYWSGYISNFRMTLGTAVYSGASFTVPQKGLTALPNTTLLLASDGTFRDMSKNYYSVTISGTPKAALFSPFSPSTVAQNSGNYSMYTNASAVVTPAVAATNIGTNDFTVEFWYYMTATNSYGTIFNLGAYNTGLFIRIDTQTYDVYIVGSQVFATGTAPLNTWVHLALVRKSGSVYLWANGVQVGTTVSNSTSISPTAAILIGTSAHTSGESFTGYICNLRLVIGNGLYTSAFTPPTSAVTAIAGTAFLSLANPTLIDLSTNNLNIATYTGSPKVTPFSPFGTAPTSVTLGTLVTPYTTSGSLYFDGTGDYLSMPHNAAYELTGVSSWTIECWVYLTGSNSAYRTFISKRVSGTQWELGVNPTNSYLYFYNGTVYLSTISVGNNAWYHCAASYDGTNVRLFVNGIQGYTGAINATAGSETVFVGGITGGGQLVTGYIADLRVIRGKNVYIAPFIPPTTPALITNDTVLSIKGDASGIFDSYGGNDVECRGKAAISTSIKKFNSGSLKFNSATSDYLFINGNPIFNTGTTDWTVDCWVYLNAIPTSDAWPTSYSSHMVVCGTGTPGQGDGTDCIIGQTKLLIQINDTQYASTSTHGMVINTWYHLAFVRSSNTFIFYVNGSSLGSVAVSVSNGTGSGTYIGCETGEGAYLNGYLDDLRFSKFARYSGPYFPLPTTTIQETGPSETDPGTAGVTYVAGDGLTSATAGTSAAAIKAQTGTNADGVYWINLPTVGPTQVYCIMNSAVSGGGWMMAMKATRGTTFSYSSTHWNSVTTLNPTAYNRADGDAKFNTMNYFAGNDLLAIFPDIATNGGSLGTNPFGCWTWLETNINSGTATTMINFFNTVGTYNTGTVNTSGNYGGKFIKDAKTFSGWASGIFSSQADIRFYGFNYKNEGLSYGGTGKCRWGFGWNENGEGLYASPATLASGGATGSNDVWGGIGMDSGGGNYSAGDVISCCQDSSGINRSARVEIYFR